MAGPHSSNKEAGSQESDEEETAVKIGELDPRRIIALSLGDSLATAARLMSDEEIGALAVFDSHGLRGVFSERDLVRALADDVDLREEIDDYMTTAAVVIDIDRSLDEAIDHMDEYGVRHLVVTRGGDPVGMISARDVIAALADRGSVKVA